MAHLRAIREILHKARKPGYDQTLAWFFKTKKGEYGYGDTFLGITVPQIRIVANEFKDVSLPIITLLLSSSWHEERLLGLLILRLQFEDAKNQALEKRLYHFFLRMKKAVNNWDLVDSSAPYIVGAYWLRQYDKKKSWVEKTQDTFLASKSLWDRRIAIVATLSFIRARKFDLTLRAAKALLQDKEDLLHKATGWMLREVGKKDKKVLFAFLRTYASCMPRTMLRYAIEKCTREERDFFLHIPRA
jgi:3-methyladenine DNA glycosylase AlkD